MAKAKIDFEIIEEIAVLSTSEKGWSKEVNRVSWNGGMPKIEIREWSPNHEIPGRGITFTEEEWQQVKKCKEK